MAGRCLAALSLVDCRPHPKQGQLYTFRRHAPAAGGPSQGSRSLADGGFAAGDMAVLSIEGGQSAECCLPSTSSSRVPLLF